MADADPAPPPPPPPPVSVRFLPVDRAPNVWANYNYVEMSDGRRMAQCKHCLCFLKPTSNVALRVHTQKYCHHALAVDA